MLVGGFSAQSAHSSFACSKTVSVARANETLFIETLNILADHKEEDWIHAGKEESTIQLNLGRL